MDRFKRIIALVTVGVFIMLLPLSALAAGVINLDTDVNLTIHYTDGDKALSNAKFSLYLVATVDKYGELTVVDDFKDFSVDIRGKNDEAWKALASTLEGYALRDKITPTDSGVTDSQGKLTFPSGGKKLTLGLYLVLGEQHKQNGYRYNPQPFMVMLPTQDMESNTWLYQLTANVKYDKDKKPAPPTPTPTPEFITRKVLKVWKDNDSESRPQSITVQLLRDGEVYDSVVLSKENNWRYTWADLSDEFKWNVVEKIPSGYEVSITQEGVTFVVTNTIKDNTSDKEPENPPENPPDNPPNNPPSNPDNPNNPDNPDNPSTPNEPNLPDAPIIPETPTLPQTGQLWWPVPILITAGLFLIVLGLATKRIGE